MSKPVTSKTHNRDLSLKETNALIYDTETLNT